MALPTFIQSLGNPFLKEVRRALAQGAPAVEGWLAVDSLHLVEEAIRSGLAVRGLVMAAGRQAALEARLAGAVSAKRYLVPDALMERLVSTESSQGVIGLVEPPAWTGQDVFPPDALVVVLDGVQDPGNCGAIFRCAEAFGASGVVAGPGTANPYNSKCLRASAGSVFRVPFAASGQVRRMLDERGLKLWAAAPRQSGSVPPGEADFRGACALLIGSEGRGLHPELARGARAVSIPTRGVESLNAAVSAGILLYEAARQRNPVA
jgi:TrmH family RNA methyltransferase